MKINLPTHVGIIMDGNRRWAKNKNLPSKEGHKQGVEALEKVVRAAAKIGVRFLTVYALSAENIKERQKSEIKDLFSLIKFGFVTKLPVLKKESVTVNFFGELETLPLAVKKILKAAEKNLADGKRLQLNIAINYSGRDEIINALKKLKESQDLNEQDFNNLLYSKGLPDPDLIIRTGGQMRLSNFLLWQSAYSELYFSQKLWPDFSEADFLAAIKDYQIRKRNFGV